MAQKRFLLIRRSDRRIGGRPVYYVHFRTEAGDLLPRKSTGATTKVAAENWALDYIKKGHIPTKENLTFRAYAEPWWGECCSYCEGKIARGSSLTKGYRRIRRMYLQRHLLPVFGDYKLGKITPRMIESWLLSLRRTTLSPTTINHFLRTLKIMFTEAVRLRYIIESPAASIAQLKEVPRVRGVLTLDEITRLFREETIENLFGTVIYGTTPSTSLVPVVGFAWVRFLDSRFNMSTPTTSRSITRGVDMTG